MFKRILFICPSVAFGACGVADYVRRLAEACQASAGVSCAMLALNSPANAAEVGLPSFPVWKCSCLSDAKSRMSELREKIKDFAPDWISLQFVPYGYHPKGLPWELGDFLRQISGSARRHIFFHELTLGLHREETLKNRCYGILQRVALRKVLDSWRPDVLHTHAAPYLAWLNRHGYPAKSLPLFGNIPVLPQGEARRPVHPLFEKWVRQRDLGQPILLGGYFGTFYPGAADSSFVAKLERLSARTQKSVVLFSVGRQNSEALERWERLAASNKDKLQWISLGELTPEAVSSYFHQLDFGVAATPLTLIGKSGSVAAMRDHGLPVLVPRNDWTPRCEVQLSYGEPGIFLCTPEMELGDQFLQVKRVRASSIDVVVPQFLSTLGVGFPKV